MAYSRLKCPRCDADFGQETRFLDHLTDVHGEPDHLSLYLQLNHGGVHPTCGCKAACQVTLPWAGWKKGFTSRFARGHNARIDSIYFDKDRQVEMTAKRIDGFRSGRLKVWNNGLTKETDKRVAQQSESVAESLQKLYARGHVSWQTGLTKNNDERVAAFSYARNEALASGSIAVWNKGSTKFNDQRIANIADKISASKRMFDPRRLTPQGFIDRVNVFSDVFELLDDPQTYKNKYHKFRLRCRNCRQEQVKNLMMLEATPICFRCHPKESKGQLELFDFVKSLAPDALLSDRTTLNGLELDIFIPSRNLGIEYDGLYWHSEACGDAGRAAKKSIRAIEAGVTLFRIFEDEWRDKRLLIEAMLRHRLGFVERRVGARQCELRELGTSQRRTFINENHLDGDVRSRTAWGLFQDNELLAALSVRRAFHVTHQDWLEVARFCSKPNLIVPGALARLSTRALMWAKEHGHLGLMTYVDRRIGQGYGYEAAGFKRVRETKPRFWWTDYKHRYDRFAIRADAKNGITQEQAAESAGVVRIWGCPNVVLELR